MSEGVRAGERMMVREGVMVRGREGERERERGREGRENPARKFMYQYSTLNDCLQ